MVNIILYYFVLFILRFSFYICDPISDFYVISKLLILVM